MELAHDLRNKTDKYLDYIVECFAEKKKAYLDVDNQQEAEDVLKELFCMGFSEHFVKSKVVFQNPTDTHWRYHSDNYHLYASCVTNVLSNRKNLKVNLDKMKYDSKILYEFFSTKYSGIFTPQQFTIDSLEFFTKRYIKSELRAYINDISAGGIIKDMLAYNYIDIDETAVQFTISPRFAMLLIETHEQNKKFNVPKQVEKAVYAL